MTFTLGLLATLAVASCGPSSVRTAAGYNDTWTWDGQPWTDRSTPDRPPARRGGMLAFDSARGAAVLFGGEDLGGRMLDDTWTWDGRHWNARSPKHHPSARNGAVGVYDSARQVVWLFAGFSARSSDGRPTLHHDVWKWDGSDWTNLTPSSSPLVLSYGEAYPLVVKGASWNGPAITFDGASNNVVVVGLFTDPNALEVFETWTWDGAAWKVTAETPRPPGYLFYDPSARQVVFVADDPPDAPFQGLPARTYQLFAWDGAAWSVSDPMPQDPNRYGLSGQGSAYDPVDRVLITFGGAAPNSCKDHLTSVAVAETWRWGGAGWTLLDTPIAPPARLSTMMVWDSTRQQVVMFGGLARDACL